MSILRISFAAFALASASFLACSSSTGGTPTPAADGGSADGSTTADGGTGKTDSGTGKTDGGSTTDSGTAASDCPNAALAAEDLAYVKDIGSLGMAPVTTGSCTSADLDKVVAALNDANATGTTVAASATGNCKACLIGTTDTGAFHPITAIDADTLYDDSGASCLAKKSGKPNCGSQAIAQDECAGTACTCDGAEDAEFYACIAGVYSDAPGACADVRKSYKTECGATTEAAEKALVDTCYIAAASPTAAQDAAFKKSVLNYLCGDGAVPVQP
jgi:hypothetical protein